MIYIVINFTLTSFASWLEGRLRRGKKSTGAVLGADAVDEHQCRRGGGHGRDRCWWHYLMAGQTA